VNASQIKIAVGAVLFIVIALVVWFLFVPPYNVPKFENIDNNQTGFLIPLDSDAAAQAKFESAEYLKDKKVAAKRVQIHRRWVQKGWLYTTGDYIDIERLIVVDRSPVIREWTDHPGTGTSASDESLSAQSKDGTGLKLNFTCTAYIPEADDDHKEGAEHFLYYYKGETLAHVMDKEVRARVQAVAAEFTSQFPLETLRGTQHKLAEAVREDVVPFFKKRGISITNIGLVGGFHYVNKQIEQSIDDAITAQQMKIKAQAQQEKEKVEQQTKLNNQEIDNKTIKLRAEGEALALQAKLSGEAKAKLEQAKIDAESAVAVAKGKADAVKLAADAEAYKYAALAKNQDLVVTLKTLEVEQAWRSMWQGGVPQTIFNGMSGGQMVPIFPFGSVPGLPSPKK
jgi:SPFH domain / Band 7 family